MKPHHACTPSSRVAACSATARLRQVLEHPCCDLVPAPLARRPRNSSLPSRRLTLPPPTSSPNQRRCLPEPQMQVQVSSPFLKPCPPVPRPFEPNVVRESQKTPLLPTSTSSRNSSDPRPYSPIPSTTSFYVRPQTHFTHRPSSYDAPPSPPRSSRPRRRPRTWTDQPELPLRRARAL